MKREMFDAIKKQLCHTISLLGGKSDILSIVGSWQDTLDDNEILEMLKEYNKNIALYMLKNATDSLDTI